jgi:hypothetical protein
MRQAEREYVMGKEQRKMKMSKLSRALLVVTIAFAILGFLSACGQEGELPGGKNPGR